MAEDFTPSTADVAAAYRVAGTVGVDYAARASRGIGYAPEFDRWLAATIRQAKAEELRDVAAMFNEMFTDYTVGSPMSSDEAATYATLREAETLLRERADRIAAGGDQT